MSKEFRYFDIHGHVNFAGYDADRQEVIARAHEAGVGMITVGTDITSSKAAVELAEKTEGMWATVGLHPVYCGESHNDALETGNAAGMRKKERFDLDAFRKLAAHSKVVAIGECGLDFFHSDADALSLQREVFAQHIKLAKEANKPLMLHVRNAKSAGSESKFGTNAYAEALTMLKEGSITNANFHFFAGSLDDAHAILAARYTMSFTGVITFARNYDELIRVIPLDRMMTETDCPYVSPEPYRGKRNEPSYVVGVVKKIAEIKGMNEEEVAKQLRENVKRVWGI